MNTYRIILLNNNDYCQLKPSDKKCQYTVHVTAPDKYNAVWHYLQECRERTAINNAERSATMVPVVWEVL